MSTARLHQLVERLASLFRASLRQASTAHALKLVQLEALIYLSMANRYSDTASALTEYLGVTKGTVSETLKALERRGLLEKVPDPRDGRVVHCRPSERGRAIVADAYPAALLRGVGSEAAEASAEALTELLRALQRGHGFRSFGVCRTCRFFQPAGAAGRCGLTGERLSRIDVTRICREHEAPAET